MSGYIYFIGDPKSQWIKVGYSTSPEHRLSELLCATYEQLEILATCPGTRRDEGRIHRALRGERRREWFKACGDLFYALRAEQDGRGVQGILDAIETDRREREAQSHRRRVSRLKEMIASGPKETREAYAKILNRVDPVAAAAIAVGEGK